MARLTIAPALARWLPGSAAGASVSIDVAAGPLRDLLERAFELHPTLRGYVVDELGRLRHHVVVFVDQSAVTDKQSLSTLVSEQSEVYIFQALSGG